MTEKKYLIHDRDPLIAPKFKAILKSDGPEAIKLPARSPNTNTQNNLDCSSKKLFPKETPVCQFTTSP